MSTVSASAPAPSSKGKVTKKKVATTEKKVKKTTTAKKEKIAKPITSSHPSWKDIIKVYIG